MDDSPVVEQAEEIDITEADVVKKKRRGGKKKTAAYLDKLIDDIVSFEYPDAPLMINELRDPPPGMMALDFETEDPTILSMGSSWAFEGQGKILGVAVAWEGFDAYYPIAHETGNCALPVIDWLRRQFLRDDLKIVCMNANYDIGWARRELGIYPAGGCCDLQHMEVLLNEHHFTYSLESISQRYLGVGKDTALIDALLDHLGIKHPELMALLKYIPGNQLAPYGRMDARRTYDAAQAMLPLLAAQELMPVFELESDLIPLSVEMRRRGIRVDVEKARAMSRDIGENQMPALIAEIKEMTGVDVDAWDATSIAAALAATGFEVPMTAGKNPRPKVDAATIRKVTHPVGEKIARLRKLAKIKGTFIDGHILGHVVNGRVHPEFNQLKSESETGEGRGTITGRYSVTSPAFQQLPTRDPEFGPMFRSLVLAEEGEEIASLDYSSQEPRLTVHFAYLLKIRGADTAVEMFLKNPRTDYHQMTADLCHIPRKDAKAINLGLGYGMGGAKLARSLGLPTVWKHIKEPPKSRPHWPTQWIEVTPERVEELRAEGENVVEVAGPEAQEIINKWRAGAPFIRGLSDMAQQVVQARGYLKTLYGRRVRFRKIVDDRTKEEKYVRLHKAMNSLIQSSAADQTKLAAREMWRRGIVPMILIHDETVVSVRERAQAETVAECMTNAVTLSIPTIVDIKFGKTLGDIDK